jgi:EPS-associated MarR family transcriptional regulator
MIDDTVRYRLLTLLEGHPELSQRELAAKLGISLGKTNYCLKALIDRGLVKVQNFQNSRKKAAYLYKLTPAGMTEKIQVTRRFLATKLKEHEQLTDEIERLRAEVRSHKRLEDMPERRQPGKQQ